MSVTIKHLNADASFLLSFSPLPSPSSSSSSPKPRPFTVLLDPWITGPSTIFHSKISTTTFKHAPCIASLSDLPHGEPDLVVVSQHKSDHCNEATLRQLPGGAAGRTLIVAEPASAKLIRSWRHFDRAKVLAVERWEDPVLNGGRETVQRVVVPALFEGGEPGEVTVAYVPQRRDISKLHGAMGITYRPPEAPPEGRGVEADGLNSTTPRNESTAAPVEKQLPLSPPMSPTSPTSPTSPRSLRSYRSLSRLFQTRQQQQQQSEKKRAVPPPIPDPIVIPPPPSTTSQQEQQQPPLSSDQTSTLSPTPFPAPSTTPTTTPFGRSQSSLLSPTHSTATTLHVMSPPTSPGLASLRSVRSASTLFSSRASTLASGGSSSSFSIRRGVVGPVGPNGFSSCSTTDIDTTAASFGDVQTASPDKRNRGGGTGKDRERAQTVSVLFSPHGVAYSSVAAYAASHLAAECAPLSSSTATTTEYPPRASPHPDPAGSNRAFALTALLHCYDAVSNPWWLGGNICAGFPVGREVAARLRARAWVSAHDGDKDVRGWGTSLLKTRRFRPAAGAGDDAATTTTGRGKRKKKAGGGRPGEEGGGGSEEEGGGGGLNASEEDEAAGPEDGEADADALPGTAMLALGIGEEVVLTGEGVWNVEKHEEGEGDGEGEGEGEGEVRGNKGGEVPQLATAAPDVYGEKKKLQLRFAKNRPDAFGSVGAVMAAV